MILRSDLERNLAELLQTARFDDYCVNGLQIEGKPEIRRIVTGVSVSAKLFEAAVRLEADAVMVHHGLFWKSTPHPLALRGILKERVKLLLEREISLFAYHLPLDSHPVLGNNARLARALGLENIVFIPSPRDSSLSGAMGQFSSMTPWSRFKALADSVLETDGLALPFERQNIRSVYIISGGGGGLYEDAVAAGADVFLTGELREDVVRASEEHGLALYAAGHYNSEKWGIQALGEHLEREYQVEVEFVDIPNPV